MEDRALVCRDCGKDFVFSASEQEFFASRAFEPPLRCPDCRASRKRQRTESEYAPRSADNRFTHSGETRNWTEVVCAECGCTTRVPFRPSAGKPVYCNDCFRAQRQGGVSSEGSRAAAAVATLGSKPRPAAIPRLEETSLVTNAEEWIDDIGPLPDIEPAPDEEGEITQADFVPMSFGFGATPEEVAPEFKE